MIMAVHVVLAVQPQLGLYRLAMLCHSPASTTHACWRLRLRTHTIRHTVRHKRLCWVADLPGLGCVQIQRSDHGVGSDEKTSCFACMLQAW
jgi:hypothetical protein